MGGLNDGSDAGDSTMQLAAGAKGEPDQIVALRLQLALAKQETKRSKEERLAKEAEWERAKQRLGMSPQEGTQAARQTSGALEVKDIKHLLPCMSDVDILSFFMCYERVLELNDVDRALWARYLPAQLSPKALKTFSRLSLQQSKDYDEIKRAILTSYKLDSNAYLRR